MIKELYYLTKLQICNLFGINEARFSREPKQKKRAITMLAIFALLGGVLVFYAVGLSVLLIEFGLGEIVPLYLVLLSTIMIFGLTILKAGALFGVKAYEKLAVLPVSNAVVVASRFMSLYIVNFLFAFVITVSGGIAYGVMANQGAWFYFSICLSSAFIPLLPMSVALAIGVGVYAITSRFKKNNALRTAFTLVFVIVCVAFPSFFQEQSDAEFIGGIATAINVVGVWLFPLNWLAKGTAISGIGYYVLFLASSVLVFLAFSLVVGRFYKTICSGLSSNATKGQYSVGEMKTGSPLFALYKRELKGYVSSSTYFINTIIGNILALLLSVTCLFTRGSELFESLGLPVETALRFLPFVFALCLVISPSTACAISMEGKGWELTKSLPVSSKTVMNAKLLVSFTFSLPVTILGEICLGIGLKATGMDLVWLLVAPLIIVTLVTVAGLFINAKNPMLHWENEAQAVKQATSTLFTLLFGMIAGILPIICTVALPSGIADFALAFVLLIMMVLSYWLYKNISKISLNSIDEK
jgi:ABC-2 type transport system permease protein